MSQLMGWVLEVDTMPLGSTLTADTAIGATTLAVWDAFDFEPTGGTLSLNGTQYAYTAADPDTDIITLAAPLDVAALEADQVIAWDADNGTEMVETVALVEVENVGDEDDPVPCSVSHSLIPMLPAGSRGGRGETVVVDESGGRWRVVDVLAAAAVMDAGYLDPGWADYTPVLTNDLGVPIDLGTGGEIAGKFAAYGKTVHWQASVYAGTGSGPGAGTYNITLPAETFDNNVGTAIITNHVTGDVFLGSVLWVSDAKAVVYLARDDGTGRSSAIGSGFHPVADDQGWNLSGTFERL